MSHRILSRRTNGQFRPTPSLEELGLDVAKTERICNVCGEKWFPVLISGKCTLGHQDSRPIPTREEEGWYGPGDPGMIKTEIQKDRPAPLQPRWPGDAVTAVDPLKEKNA